MRPRHEHSRKAYPTQTSVPKILSDTPQSLDFPEALMQRNRFSVHQNVKRTQAVHPSTCNLVQKIIQDDGGQCVLSWWQYRLHFSKEHR